MPSRLCLGPDPAGNLPCPTMALVLVRRGEKRGARCPDCRRIVERARSQAKRARRPYTAEDQRLRAQTVQAWIEMHGYVCPGWQRPAHPADPERNPLTADHVVAVAAGGHPLGPYNVLCRSCNSAKGAGR
jgi:5-methylcytosine-specific restriction enzyme A